MLSNCKLNGNSGTQGGGASNSTLNNCELSGNSATDSGGGATECILNNCTLTGNSAGRDGGGVGFVSFAKGNSMNNCIVYFNSAPLAQDYHPCPANHLNYCCTTPMPTNGIGNITNAPMFVDYAEGDLRPQYNSPCINAGNNSYLADLGFTNYFDLGGNPRIVSGTVDIGAYEFQGTGSTISYAWLQQFGLPTDGSVDSADLDDDGHITWQEWRCQTCPTNGDSALRLVSAQPAGTNMVVTWQSAGGVSYKLERSSDLTASPGFSLLATNIPGQPGTTSYMDTNTANVPSLFYRVSVP